MRRIVSLLLAMSAMSMVVATARPKLSPDLTTAPPNSDVKVVIQWNCDVGATTSQIIQQLGGLKISEFPSLRAGNYFVPQSALSSLEANSNVKYVSVDRQVRRKLAVAAAAINAPGVWKIGFVGTGVGVAIVDSGMTQDTNLASDNRNLVYTEDFVNPIPIKSDGQPGAKPAGYGLDWYGHGQHIAGIIASNGKDSHCGSCNKSFVGIAPGANLINLKVLDTNGQGSDAAVMAAIDRAISLKSTYNIRVMNLSLGRAVYESYTQDPLCQAVEAAWRAGIVVVVAAGNDGRDNSFGNDGYGTITAPGNDPYVITVGAMKTEGTPSRADDLIASYSSKGPTAIDHIVKPDVLAPGNQIVSLLAQPATLPMEEPGNLVPFSNFQNSAPPAGSYRGQVGATYGANGQPMNVQFPGGYSHSYFILSGTSMAAAVVSGAAADLIQAAPSLTPDQVKILLMETASKSFPVSSSVIDPASDQVFTDYYDIFTVGAGYIDLSAAMAAVRQVPPGFSAISPLANFDATTGDVNLTFDPTTIFSNKALWGTSSIWGSSVLTGSKALWGTQSVWGSSLDSGEKALWGTSAIWSNKALWGTSSESASESVEILGEP